MDGDSAPRQLRPPILKSRRQLELGSSKVPASKVVRFGMVRKPKAVTTAVGMFWTNFPMNGRLLVMETRRTLIADDAVPSGTVPWRSVKC